MIRFVEMTGIYLDDKKSFGFFNTVTLYFLDIGGFQVLDSVNDFETLYSQDCGYDYERLRKLIPQSWLNYVEED